MLFRGMGYKCAVPMPKAKAKAKPSMGKHIHVFKLTARRIVKKFLNDEAKDFVKVG